MKVRTSWPWIAVLLAVVLALNPIGIAVISATTSGEQLAQQIGMLLFAVGVGGIALFALIEFGVRKYLMARQRRKGAQSMRGA